MEATSSVFCGGRNPSENYPERPRSRRRRHRRRRRRHLTPLPEDLTRLGQEKMFLQQWDVDAEYTLRRINCENELARLDG